MNYLAVSDLVELHDHVITASGGLQGMRDTGVLESILAHIQNDEYYPDFAAKLTHLVYAVNKSHAFNDGNKRTSIMAGVYFLLLNGWETERVAHFAVSMEDIAVDIAANKISKETLAVLIMFVLSSAKTV
ncbi:type II toxin-antitoxin system death-on-curing family toxin [Neisseria chenwenguii]|uniref:Type II toxin-antitoxin system death-on-curing family toxin n=1 Tax=Neisseria chenwenguii TaxID=1853278 RepID=A0A220S194_9NEIS|nr:type II toxin-antitoxin system death-on-curing family toxin [Neisseria chenwenguii]ASK27251.1 type II toxin-antitoxin system death-on-curing family toxin [Neisseria chenwenguii]ROV53859.1 type II toxin-antitoxin system death-on-curing family toxin [Neisseria chenwenguii]